MIIMSRPARIPSRQQQQHHLGQQVEHRDNNQYALPASANLARKPDPGPSADNRLPVGHLLPEPLEDLFPVGRRCHRWKWWSERTSRFVECVGAASSYETKKLEVTLCCCAVPSWLTSLAVSRHFPSPAFTCVHPESLLRSLETTLPPKHGWTDRARAGYMRHQTRGAAIPEGPDSSTQPRPRHLGRRGQESTSNTRESTSPSPTS